MKHTAILNPKAKALITEFFDYNCIHCKREFAVIEQLLTLNADVGVILRPIPILGENSLYATQIGHAILMMDNEKYVKYYESLMKNFDYEADHIQKALKAANVSTEELTNVLKSKSEEIGKAIQDDLDEADKLGINGTPAFVIDGKVIPGAVSYEELEEALK